MPRVSVLMCAHNAERFIQEAVDSILSQTYRDFEFIIVENASSDDTWRIVRSYEDPRIRAFRTPLRQLTFNLNFGLIQTEADYVARMDADDIAEPMRLARQVAYLDAHPDIGVLGTAFTVLRNSKPDRTVVLPLTDRDIRWRLPFCFTICHPTVMFRREVVLRQGGYRVGGYCQDVDLWLRLSRDKTFHFANLSEPLLKYRIHTDQAKGKREGYIAVAIILLSESFIQRSAILFLGFLLAFLKLIGFCRNRCLP